MLLRGCLGGATPLLRLRAVFSCLTLCSHHTVNGESRQLKACRSRATLALHLTLHGHRTHEGIILVVPCTSLLVRCTVEGLVRSDYADVESWSMAMAISPSVGRFSSTKSRLSHQRSHYICSRRCFNNINRGGLGIVIHFCITAHVSLSVCFYFVYFKVTVGNWQNQIIIL